MPSAASLTVPTSRTSARDDGQQAARQEPWDGQPADRSRAAPSHLPRVGGAIGHRVVHRARKCRHIVGRGAGVGIAAPSNGQSGDERTVRPGVSMMARSFPAGSAGGDRCCRSARGHPPACLRDAPAGPRWRRPPAGRSARQLPNYTIIKAPAVMRAHDDEADFSIGNHAAEPCWRPGSRRQGRLIER